MPPPQVCAVSLVGQWVAEAQAKLGGSLRIHMYHGQNRIRDPGRLATAFDLVTGGRGHAWREGSAVGDARRRRFMAAGRGGCAFTPPRLHAGCSLPCLPACLRCVPLMGGTRFLASRW
jgi:hypothetical protein